METAPEPTPVPPARAPDPPARAPDPPARAPDPPGRAPDPPPDLSRPARVLIVEDEPALQRALRINLRARGYEVATAAAGREGLTEAASRQPDAVLLDLGLPDLDGTAVIRELRGWSRTPVIVISGRAGSGDKINALDAGADDYVTKPFSMEELLARLRAVLRRDDNPVRGTKFRIGRCEIDLVAYTVVRHPAAETRAPPGGPSPAAGSPVDLSTPVDPSTPANPSTPVDPSTPANPSTSANPSTPVDPADPASPAAPASPEIVHLTPTEWRLLEILLHSPGQLVSSDRLLSEVWGPGHTRRTHYLRFHMARLRRKLEEDPPRPRHLLTEPGMGYRYQP
jgi:two-component system, OmpR family, KDP operon response regulator KdpE